MVVGYMNTSGVTMRPSLMHSGGKLNNTEKLIPMSAARKAPAYVVLSSPVVSGLALVLSTCLSMSLSQKSFIIQPALRHDSAPTVKRPIVDKLGIKVGELNAKPQ